ncbi:MAG: CGNR zinc finger domain-containing protein [Myxococcota bacterium]
MDADIDELPILGEPLAVELANTRYGQGDDAIDFLGTGAAARVWLEASAAAPTPGVRDLGPQGLTRLSQLRDAVHELCAATVDGRPVRRSILRAINDASALAPPQRALALGPGGVVGVHTRRVGSVLDRLLATLADETFGLFEGEASARLRRCPGPECGMFFVQHHHRRRFCHASCSHRARQAAYYRRRRDAQVADG